MTGSWLLGVFVFAILIGDIRDIVGTARRNALSFQRQLDAITTYMNNNKVAKHVQVCINNAAAACFLISTPTQLLVAKK